MKNIWKRLVTIVGVASVTVTAALAQDSGALVDALVKKGVLTDQEAEEIRADLTKEYTTSSAGKLQIGSYVNSLKLYGDVRYRYELDNRTADATTYSVAGVATPGVVSERLRNRNRIRVRVGAEFAFTDNFKANIRLATGAGGNTTNADLGAPGAVGGSGAFATTASGTDAIHLDLAYLEYDKAFGLDWLQLTAGKQYMTQNVVLGWDYDSDINPEGGLVRIGDFSFGDFSVGASSGAYIYGDTTDKSYGTSFAASSAAPSGDDTWQLINQVDFKYKFSKDMTARISPGFMNYMGTTLTSAAAPSTLAVAGNGAAYDVRDLNILFVNGEFIHPLWYNWKNKIYGDYAVNFSGNSRARAETNLGIAGTPTDGKNDDGRNQLAVVGMTQTLGKGKGAWAFDETLAYQEAYSWDPLLTDSDWNGGYLNGAGFGLKASYSFTDFLTATVNWRHSSVIDHDIMARSFVVSDLTSGTGGTETKTDLVQIDLTWKF